MDFFSTFLEVDLDFPFTCPILFPVFEKGSKMWWNLRLIMAERSLEKVKKQQLFFGKISEITVKCCGFFPKWPVFLTFFLTWADFICLFHIKCLGGGTRPPFYVERHIERSKMAILDPKWPILTHFWPLFYTLLSKSPLENKPKWPKSGQKVGQKVTQKWPLFDPPPVSISVLWW